MTPPTPAAAWAMADIGFEAAEPQRSRRRMGLPIGRKQRLPLDGIAKPGAGAVRLDGVDVLGTKPGARQRLADDVLLRRTVGRGQALAPAVLIGGRAREQGQDGMAVTAGVGQALEQQHASAFGPARPISLRGERLAAAVGGQPSLAAERNKGSWRRHQSNAASQRQAAFSPAQRLRGEVDGHQRGAAGGIDADGRTLQAEAVGDTAGGDTGCAASAYIPLMFGWHVCEAARIVVVHNTDEDAALASIERGRIDAGPLQRFPGRLQQQIDAADRR